MQPVADFQEIFTEETGALYLLPFLLTADHTKVEACFVSGIGECVEGTQIFKEWARRSSESRLRSRAC